jgi:hypothetical protein
MGYNITLTIKPNRILIEDLNVNEAETKEVIETNPTPGV